MKNSLDSFNTYLHSLGLDKDSLDRLHPVAEKLAAHPAGREILGMVQKLNINIRFKTGMSVTGTYSPKTKTITLNEKSGGNSALLLAFAHELRHAWQFSELGISHDNAAVYHKVGTRLNFNRMIEGDAFAFAAMLRDQLALDDIPHNPKTTEKLKSLSKTEQYRFYFMASQKRLDGYDRQGLLYQEGFIKTLGLIPFEDFPPEKQKSVLEETGFVHAFSPAYRLENLRRIAIAGFSSEAGNYLDGISHRQLFFALRMTGQGVENTAELNKINKIQSPACRKLQKMIKSLRP